MHKMVVSFISGSSRRYTICGGNCLTGKCCQARLEEQRNACLELQRQAEATHERKAVRFVLEVSFIFFFHKKVFWPSMSYQ